ncbi:hypothetical protein ES703_10086 [subsurface metagenome]
MKRFFLLSPPLPAEHHPGYFVFLIQGHKCTPEGFGYLAAQLHSLCPDDNIHIVAVAPYNGVAHKATAEVALDRARGEKLLHLD